MISSNQGSWSEQGDSRAFMKSLFHWIFWRALLIAIDSALPQVDFIFTLIRFEERPCVGPGNCRPPRQFLLFFLQWRFLEELYVRCSLLAVTGILSEWFLTHHNYLLPTAFCNRTLSNLAKWQYATKGKILFSTSIASSRLFTCTKIVVLVKYILFHSIGQMYHHFKTKEIVPGVASL